MRLTITATTLLSLTPLALAYTPARAPRDETPTPTYAPCGGDTKDGPVKCPDSHECIEDPRKEGCGMACDDTGICVPKGLEMCGGFAGFACPEGLICVDDPFDDCSVETFGADCAGICV